MLPCTNNPVSRWAGCFPHSLVYELQVEGVAGGGVGGGEGGGEGGGAIPSQIEQRSDDSVVHP
jgi:hypothetical protein